MLPSGTVTFLFSDIEGSTRLLDELGDQYADALEEHRRIFRDAIEREGGAEVDSSGDAFLAAFPRASGAVTAAASIQRLLHDHPWPGSASVRVRIGLHTGEPDVTSSGYTGMDVHRGARICAAGHGGQVLLSETTRELVQHDLSTGLRLRELGEHQLKDLNRPQRLYQLVIEGLQSDFPPLRTLNNRTHNLPLQPTSLVGRERDIRAVTDLLLRPNVRLVTLTGAGGTGKTRLSLQVSANLIDDFRDGVFFVPLAFTTDPSLVPSAVAKALQVRENPAVPVLDALRDRLLHQQILLLIDNFEQVTAAADFIGDLLRAAPEVKILVTSRTTLHLSAEHEYAVPPLDLPRPGRNGGADALSQYAAVELFIQRAKAVRPDFMITDTNAPAVAEICFRLDGLPLAIELAAARTKLFSPREMLTRLSKPLELLRGGPRDVPDRHQTLQRAIAWSYDLLAPDEKVLFRRLSVFAGGCRLEAAEAVCGTHSTAIDVIEGVHALVDKSLLRPVESADGETRFVMLETIREYGLQRLGESSEEAAVRRAHAEYFMDVAETAEPHLTSEDQIRWLDLIERDHDNFRHALSWVEDTGEVEIGVRTAAAIWRFWIVRGLLIEGRRQLERLRAMGRPQGSSQAWIKLLNALGTMTHVMGDFPSARDILQDVLETSLELNDRQGIASSLNNLSWVLYELGDMKPARDLAEQARELCHDLGDRRGEAGALTNLAMISNDESRFDDALRLMREAHAIRTQIGEKRGIGYALGMTASVLVGVGAYEEADRLMAECLVVADEVRDKQGPAYILSARGHMYIEQCRFDDAEIDFQRALPLWTEMGAKYGLGYVGAGLGLVALARGELEHARAQLSESLATFRRTGQKRYVGMMLINLGHVESARQDYREARARYEEGRSVLEEIGDRRTLADCLMGIAEVERAEGNADASRQTLERAHRVLDEIGAQPTPWQKARDLSTGTVASG